MEPRRYLPPLLIFLALAVAIFYYPQLPDPMPSHWDSRGQVDGYMQKDLALFFLPAIAFFFYLFARLIPKIDPLRTNIETFRREYDEFIIVVTAFLIFIYLGSIIWALGYQINFISLVALPLAGLFYFMSDLLAKSKRNFFIGIRTPWTLSDDKVWEETHKLGAKMFKGFGLLFLIPLLYPQAILYIIAVILLGTAYLFYHSYKLHDDKAFKQKSD